MNTIKNPTIVITVQEIQRQREEEPSFCAHCCSLAPVVLAFLILFSLTTWMLFEAFNNEDGND